MLGGWGLDTLLGGTGDDTLDGEAGADILDGGEGDDVIVGYYDTPPGVVDERDQIDRDTIYGGDGEDVIFLGSGDIAYGGEGVDVFASGVYVHDEIPVIEDYTADEDLILLFTLPGDGTDGEITVEPVTAGSEDMFIALEGQILARVNGVGTSLDPTMISIAEFS